MGCHNTLHAIGATFEGAGFVGTKTWGDTSGGAMPLLILWDSGTGELKAVIEAFALGQMRTGAMSGVATRWLAVAEAHDMAVIGTGKQALTQVDAVAAVRPLTRVREHIARRRKTAPPSSGNARAYLRRKRRRKAMQKIALDASSSQIRTTKRGKRRAEAKTRHSV